MINNTLGTVASMVCGLPIQPYLDVNGAIINSCQHGFHASKVCSLSNCPHRVDMSGVGETESEAETVDYGMPQCSASEAGMIDVNSEDSDGEGLTNQRRYPVGGWASASSSLHPQNAEFTSSIAIYSREASENFARAYRAKIEADEHNRVIAASTSGISKAEVDRKLSLCPTSIVSGDLEDQFEALFENKGLPHIIAVIEGAEHASSLINIKAKVGDDILSLPYEKLPFITGTNAALGVDHKQSMTLYRRIDLWKAYTVSEELVSHGTEEIRCASVRYQVGSQTFETLIVHTPNKFVGSSPKDAATIEAFKTYAGSAALKTPPRIVTAFIGDTNFKKQMQENSSPGIGGHTSISSSLSPQSSSSSSSTNFMQVYNLGLGKSHVVLHPSQLNNVLLPPGPHQIAIDHPSFMHRTGHSLRIENRDPSKLPAWYRF